MEIEQFKFPSIYHFAPFFTQQPNERTWHAQLGHWDSLVLEYCAHYRIWTLDLGRTVAESGLHSGAVDGELFNNGAINRGLKPDTLRSVLEYMASQGHLEWYAETAPGEYGYYGAKMRSTKAIVYFKTPEEWADAIAEWVDSSGLGGTVLTLYELAHGDMVTNQSFCGMHGALLRRAIDVLAQRGQAVLMKGADKAIVGVKML
ncbi:vacuolar protein-sorting-associated protein 25 [Trichomonascus vanleenenianus]|uniref:ESCRT-II subunit protein VPS25 n=1 Tax=Trichomonascus vanleenenianus TaxID=2268995 RepID=UPI003ECA207F